MTEQQINQHTALALLKKGENIRLYHIVFDDATMEALDAMLLRKHGVVLPEELVYYADAHILFDDDADLAGTDLDQGNLVRVLHADVKVNNEIANWVQNNSIDLNHLLSELIQAFYQKRKAS